MTYDAFRALVLRMRDAQRHYFRSRDTNALGEARLLEAVVDSAIVDAKRGGEKQLFKPDTETTP